MIKNTENENSLFEAKILGLLKKTEKDEEGVSVFLTPKEQIIASRIIAQARTDAVTFFFGGYDGSERNKLFALPEYMAPGGPLDVKSIFETCNGLIGENVSAVRVQGSGYKKLTHRDYLGSVMGLGLKREVIGDIAPCDDFAVMFGISEIAQFIKENLTQVAKSTVHAEILDSLDGIDIKQNYLEIRGTVASCRVDCIVSFLKNTGRGAAAELLRAGYVKLNAKEVQDTSKLVKAGDVISIRGLGKFIFDGEAGTSRKGRAIVEIRKLI